MTGDFNSRTSDLNDILDFDNYLDIEDENPNDVNSSENIVFIPKHSNKDKIIDTYCIKLISIHKSTNHLIINGHFYDDKETLLFVQTEAQVLQIIQLYNWFIKCLLLSIIMS